MSDWIPIDAPVDAKATPITVRLAHYSPGASEFDDYGMPWAVLGLCRVTFRFNHDLVTTKRITARYSWHDSLGRPKSERPPDNEIQAAREAVATMVRDRVARHGLVLPSDWEVVEGDEVPPYTPRVREAVDF